MDRQALLDRLGRNVQWAILNRARWISFFEERFPHATRSNVDEMQINAMIETWDDIHEKFDNLRRMILIDSDDKVLIQMRMLREYFAEKVESARKTTDSVREYVHLGKDHPMFIPYHLVSGHIMYYGMAGDEISGIIRDMEARKETS